MQFHDLVVGSEIRHLLQKQQVFDPLFRIQMEPFREFCSTSKPLNKPFLLLLSSNRVVMWVTKRGLASGSSFASFTCFRDSCRQY